MSPKSHVTTDLLKRVEEQELTCKDFGFYWETLDQLIDQITSECKEIKEAFEKGDEVHLQEEVGDLLQAAISLAVFCKLDPHQTLQNSIDKFQRRYEAVVAFAKQDGLSSLANRDFATLMHYWNLAKKHGNTSPQS